MLPVPDIVNFPGKTLAGVSMAMSFADNRTPELWSAFMPVRQHLQRVSDDLYSVERYPDGFFENFSMARPFSKWAAMETGGALPENWSELDIPPGLYAVFFYKGLPAAAAPFYNEIFARWLPASGFILDNRPHFALMGERYDNQSTESEETIWIPIKTNP